MVQLNNRYALINTPAMGSYLRNLNDYRIGVELALLSVLDYFIANSEASGNDLIISSNIIYEQKNYLFGLARKYHKREFDFKIKPGESLTIYDTLSTLIRKSRKSLEHSLLDSVELMSAHPEVFKGERIHPGLALTLCEVASNYEKIVPEKIKRVSRRYTKPNVHVSDKPALPQIQTKASSFDLYVHVLSQLYIVARDELLKMSDFLLETDETRIRSNKLLEIQPDLSMIGESLYGKLRPAVEIIPRKEDVSELLETGEISELIIDEWSSNLRRIIESTHENTLDFSKYLSSNPEDAETFKGNRDLHIQNLLYFTFGDDLPKVFSINN